MRKNGSIEPTRTAGCRFPIATAPRSTSPGGHFISNRSRGVAGAMIGMFLGLSSEGCASTPCSSVGPCGLASWTTQPSPALGDARMVLAPATSATSTSDGEMFDESDRLPIGTSPVVLDFDVSDLHAGDAIDRAVVALTPHVDWQTGGTRGRLRVRAWAVTSHWTMGSVGASGAPALGPAPVGEVVLHAGVRVPIRIDVTEAVRAWHDGRHEGHGIALSCEGGQIVVAGVRANDASARPRLEVAAR